jgi:DNA polymerase elongation subunit (family B)
MYQAVYIDRFKKISYVRDDKEGWIVEEYNPYAFKKHPQGEYTGLFGDKFKKVFKKNYQKGDLDVHEQDVDPTLRVLTDMYLHEDNPPEFHRLVYFDIETEIGGTLNKANIKKALNKITSIAILDKLHDKIYALIVDEKGEIEHKTVGNKEVIPFKNESFLLKRFIEIWEEISPTVIVGYNSAFFDVPYLFYRISKKLGKEWAYRLSPIGIVNEQEWSDDFPVKICGVSHLDYMLLYKKFVPKVQPSYKLDYIAKKEIGKGKLEFKGSLDKLFREDIEKYIEYNVNDVTLLDEIDNKLSFIELAIAICHFAHTQYDNIYFSSLILDGVIFTHLKRKGIVSPNKPVTDDPSLKKDMDDEDMDDEVGFKGAYVKEPQVGVHRWLSDLDKKSLYPSSIISLNIGSETLIGRVVVEEFENEGLSSDSITIEYLRNCPEYITIEKPDLVRKKVKSLSVLNQILSNGWCMAPNGVIFRTDVQSTISEVLELWAEKREFNKNKMKEYRKLLDFDKAKFYDLYQQVFKTFSNSIYGCLALYSFRYTEKNKWLSSVTTMTGQCMIKTSINYVNEDLNKILNTNEDYIVASDTDSLFMKCFPLVKHRLGYDIDPNQDDIIIPMVEEIADEYQRRLNSFYDECVIKFFNIKKHLFIIKPEYVIKSAYWSAKKKYACYLVRKEGTPIKQGEEFDYKGLDLMKSNFSLLFKEFSMKMINTLLLDTNKETIDSMVIEFKKYLMQCSYKEYASPSGLKQPLEKYIVTPPSVGKIFTTTDSGTPAHFKSSIRYNDMVRYLGRTRDYPELRIGEQVATCYLIDNPYKIDSIGYPVNDEYPEEIDKFINKYVDKHKTFDNQLLTKIQKFYDTLGWGQVNLNENKNKNRWKRLKQQH